MSIREVVIKVLEDRPDGLSITEIFEEITKNNLFEFKTKAPISVLSAEIKKSCDGVISKKSRDKKFFKKLENGKYLLI